VGRVTCLVVGRAPLVDVVVERNIARVDAQDLLPAFLVGAWIVIRIPPARRISSGFAHTSTLVAREATVLAVSARTFTIEAVGAALPPAIA
jgi:hypothetical protein